MRLVGRILVVVAVASVPAVVTLIGCGVQGDRYPGLENEVPNKPGSGGPPVTGSSSSGSTTSSSSSSSTSGSGGMGLNTCQCALTFLMPPGDGGALTPCAQCGADQAGAAGSCFNEQTDCNSDPTGACQAAFSCIATTCSDPVTWNTCIALCIKTSPVYQALADCQCNHCQQQCAVAMPIMCDLDGGAGDGGDGG